MHAPDTYRCTHAKGKNLRAKEDKQFKLSICGAGVVVSTKHLPSPSKQEYSSTVELEIGGVAAPE
jgi:hypothetical protein